MIETPKKAARRLSAKAVKDGFKPEALHEYKDADGNILYWRIRLKHPDGRKWIKPMRLNGYGYELKEPEFTGAKPLSGCLSYWRILISPCGLARANGVSIIWRG